MYSQPRLARVEEAPRIHELLLAIGLSERVAGGAGVQWVRERWRDAAIDCPGRILIPIQPRANML